jgi:hypothetical protein
LAAISAAITSADANIAQAQIHPSSQKAVNTFEVMIRIQHLKEVLQSHQSRCL